EEAVRSGLSHSHQARSAARELTSHFGLHSRISEPLDPRPSITRFETRMIVLAVTARCNNRFAAISHDKRHIQLHVAAGRFCPVQTPKFALTQFRSLSSTRNHSEDPG
ncbi:hypothetical protein TNCV_3169811, partial [Trichonephila clavipes]